MPRDRQLPEGSYGSLDRDGLRRWIEAHRQGCPPGLKDGRFWFKPVPFQSIAHVMCHGLRPERENYQTGQFARRPGCILLHWPDTMAATYELEWGTGPNLHYVDLGVPVAAVDPRRLLPDEDLFNREQFDPPIVDPTDFGVPHCDTTRWPSAGAWADDVRLGAQHGTVEVSLNESGRVVARGVIPPTSLRLLLSSPPGYRVEQPITHYSPDQVKAMALASEED